MLQPIERSLFYALRQRLTEERQIAIVSGPRQAGKTTLAKQLLAESGPDAERRYFNWDNASHRKLFLKGPAAVAESVGLDRLQPSPPLLVFDEIHKFRTWKSWLKGFFDTYETRMRLIVTGSARMDYYRRGGDSLVGRYFVYRLHPLSLGELTRSPGGELRLPTPPVQPQTGVWPQLQTFGGFPEPYLHANGSFSRRWSRTRYERLLREDLRDLGAVQDIDRIEHLAILLRESSGQQINYSNLAREIGVAVDTVKRWLALLENLYVGFTLRPWFKNVRKSLRKEPKWYLWDWSDIADPGQRYETMLAVHLKKHADWLSDVDGHPTTVHYLRTKDGREADFILVQNQRPFWIVEAKTSAQKISSALTWLQNETKAGHAFQAVSNLDFVAKDCFRETTPLQVPATTLLAQLA